MWRASVVGHVSRCGTELGVGLDHFVDGVEKVLLRTHLASRSDGEHTCLRAHTANLSTCKHNDISGLVEFERAVRLSVVSWLLDQTCAVGTETREQLVSNVFLNAHRLGVNFEDVCTTLFRDARKYNNAKYTTLPSKETFEDRN